MFTMAGWWGESWANFIADVTVALLFGFGLVTYLGRQQKAREEQEELTRAVQLLREELLFNYGQAKLASKELGQGRLLFPLFDTGTGDVLLNNPQLIRGAQVDLMSQIANRMLDFTRPISCIGFSSILWYRREARGGHRTTTG